MGIRVNRAVVSLLALAAPAGAAMGQNVSNEAWLGQIGSLNTLDIEQAGRANSAGADNVYLLLEQDGAENVMEVRQTGYANKLGTLYEGIPEYARGVGQRGNHNRIDIEQSSEDPELGGNMIASVQQRSGLDPAGTAHNVLEIVQTSDEGGAGNHSVGRVVQWAIAGGAPNSATISQTGGGAGLGNVLANLRQVGGGNEFELVQTGAGNRVGEDTASGDPHVGGVRQIGAANSAKVSQSGEANVIENIRQSGAGNKLIAIVAGERNAVFFIHQDSLSWADASVGNTAKVTITGRDNGGAFELAGPLALEGVGHGRIVQFGFDNNLRLTVSEGVETRFGVTQDGDGNDAYIAIGNAGADATGNETAVHQLGNRNYLSHIVTGSYNAGAIRQEGEDNHVALSQTGDHNHARIDMDGDSNGALGAVLFGPAGALAAEQGLTQGSVVQSGVSGAAPQTVSLTIKGDGNAFSLAQLDGASNAIEAGIIGDGNALAVVQQGESYSTSLSMQIGSGNALSVHQF